MNREVETKGTLPEDHCHSCGNVVLLGVALHLVPRATMIDDKALGSPVDPSVSMIVVGDEAIARLRMGPESDLGSDETSIMAAFGAPRAEVLWTVATCPRMTRADAVGRWSPVVAVEFADQEVRGQRPRGRWPANR